MGKFKVGGAVRCYNNDKLEGVLREGGLYVIESISGNSLAFTGKTGGYYSGDRFETVVPKPEPKADPTYTVTWKVEAAPGFQSLIDGELSFGTEDEAEGFADLFRSDVRTTVTKDE
tara:strand:+ start:2962 stop:3309 length:348 start_codon:yes stop_codon:yes gene_type:complete